MSELDCLDSTNPEMIFSSPSFPLDRLPPDLSLQLMEYLSLACDPPALLSLMRCNKEMCSYFGKSLYRDLVLDKRNAWNVCLGINWDLDSVDEKGVDAGSMRAQREDTIEYPREGILKRLAQVLKLKRPSIQQITQPSEPEKTPFPPSIPTPFGLDTLSIHRRKVELLNHVQYLYINDLESAAYVCRALGTDIVSRSEPKDQPCSYPHPPARTFKGVQTIALGFDLMKSETSFFGSKIGGLLMGMSWDQIGFFDPYQHPNPENTLHTLACTLQPKQVCSTWCRGLESPWDCTFFWKMKDLVAGWKLESFTWHSTGGLSDPGRSAGLYLSDETRAVTSFFPPNIPRIRAFNHPTFTDHCNGSGESCECKKALRDILIHLTLEDWSDEIRNEERKVDLIGYPCLEKISTDDILGEVMESQHYLEKNEDEVERIKKDWQGRREWLGSNFRILDIDEAEGCVCCGKK